MEEKKMNPWGLEANVENVIFLLGVLGLLLLAVWYRIVVWHRASSEMRKDV
jgi:hypothetical protein